MFLPFKLTKHSIHLILLFLDKLLIYDAIYFRYHKSLLNGLSAKITFRKVFDLKRLKIIFCRSTYFP